jgi:hypothetical protein
VNFIKHRGTTLRSQQKSTEHKTPQQHIYSFVFNLLFTFEDNADFKIRFALSLELFSISIFEPVCENSRNLME